MKTVKAQFNLAKLAILAAPAALLVACGTSDASDQAATLHQANAVYVSSNQCQSSITNAMADHDLGVTSDSSVADSTLQVSIESQGRNLDEIPEFGGFGHKATYTATLIGAEGAALFSTTGEEGSTTFDELCEDIGDEIAERMQERRHG